MSLLVWNYEPAAILTTVMPTEPPTLRECFTDGELIYSLNDTSDGQLRVFEGAFEVCIGGLYGSVCDIGWNQAAAQVVCHSQFGNSYGS